MKRNFSIPFSQWAVALLFIIFTGALLYGLVMFCEPKERQPKPPFTQRYSTQALLNELTEQKLQQRLAQIAAASSPAGEYSQGRYTGSQGFYNTEKLIHKTFDQAGLEVKTQEFPVVVPVTEYCQVLDKAGKPLPGITLYPFEPNGLCPTVLPPEGMTAKLVVGTSTDPLDLRGKAIEKNFYLNQGMANCSWPIAAGLGAKAVIVQESKMDASGDPDVPAPWNSMSSQYDLPYPRFVARGPLEKYAGQELTIKCKVTWQQKRVNNLIGILHGANPGNEALVINSYYDSYSAVPDLSPGAEQAVSLAAMLQYVQALAPYKGQLSRDVIFVATAGHAQSMEGANRLQEAIETVSTHLKQSHPLTDQLKDNQTLLGYAQHARQIVDTDEPWQAKDNAAFADKWSHEDPAFRAWFEKCMATVAGEVDLARTDEYLNARIAWIRIGRPTYRDGFDPSKATKAEQSASGNYHPLMQAFLDAKNAENRSANLLSIPFWKMSYQASLQTPKGNTNEFDQWGYRLKARDYIDRLVTYHTNRIKELNDSLELRKLFEGYHLTTAINLELYSGGQTQAKDLEVVVGIINLQDTIMPQSGYLAQAITDEVPLVGGKPSFVVSNWGVKDVEGYPNDKNPQGSLFTTDMESEYWYRGGHLGFSVMNKKFFPHKLGTPEDTFTGMQTGAVAQQLPVVGKALLAMGFGKVPFKAYSPLRTSDEVRTFRGTVYATAGTASVTPNHPMGINTYVHPYEREFRAGGMIPLSRGIRLFPIFPTDPYGNYYRKFSTDFDTMGDCKRAMGGTIDAIRFGDDGTVRYFKDSSDNAQAIFRNDFFMLDDVRLGEEQPKNVVLFRGSLVCCFQCVNPQTLSSFSAFNFLVAPGIETPTHYHFDNQIRLPGETPDNAPGIAAFLEPDCQFYVNMMDGIPGNPDVQTCRAFMLNVDPTKPIAKDEPELDGQGYLAADTPYLTLPYFDAAESMLRTNAKRLALQKTYHMADEQMLNSHETSKALMQQAWQSRKSGETALAMITAGRAFALAMNNHPVIRTKISHAVFGIIWYLALLVPFVFFFEKLLFGFTDIRKQLLAVSIIFILVFWLLDKFHPAFKMVRSPEMILLGFLIFLLSLLVTLMVGGKFQQNLAELRRKEGYVEGADINRGGVVGTAFMLGLNNMRRRKLRTGLTCGTLVLVTFVMICFTSMSTNVKQVEYPNGPASSNGLMRRDPNFQAISKSELNGIIQNYGLDYPVATQYWLTAQLDIKKPLNTEIPVDRTYNLMGESITKNVKAAAAVTMEWDEPQFSGIDKYLLSPTRGWFPRTPTTAAEQAYAAAHGDAPRNYVMLPDTMANELGLTKEIVYNTNPKVNIRGKQFEVRGIFDSRRLSEHLGLDGQPILPYDLSVTALNTAMTGKDIFVVPQDAKRLPGSQVIITNVNLDYDTGTEIEFPVSCSVLFPNKSYQLRPGDPVHPAVTYKEQRALIDEYLERIGVPSYYAIDGMAYYGSRTRSKSAGDLIELLIPLLIAALTVFNTMRGSVYERKDEIYVYNAVGIAPNHVFFMFMAEACVYAVIGAMLGYLLAQITGTVMTACKLTGGLNMDYSAIETIYASIAIMLAVLLSTLIPARAAAKLASPSEERSWTIPTAEGDLMEFNLPFTFTPHDRMAVISYFHRWLEANGEGSSGPFFCSKPETTLSTGKTSNGEETIPGITTTVWLKPFELGVSQRLNITLPTDPETGEYIARINIERLSGTTAAWNRTIMPFLVALRKQFLNWRAVGDAQRAEMFTESKTLFQQTGEAQPVTESKGKGKGKAGAKVNV